MLSARVERPENLRSTLQAALDQNGPALVEMVTHSQELAIPPSITLEQAKGFSLFMLRAVLNGRGDEVFHLVIEVWSAKRSPSPSRCSTANIS